MKEVQQVEALRLADELVEPIDGFQEPTILEAAAAAELRRQHARIAELEKENSYMNNACTELEAQLDAIGAGGVEPLSKGFVRLSDVLARLEQGFGANSAPVTTIKRHFEMQAHPTQQGLLGQRVATLWVEESGVLDFEVLPPCKLPAGEYPLHIAAQAKQGE